MVVSFAKITIQENSMAYYDHREDVKISVTCSNCGHEENKSVALGVNLNAQEVSEIFVESVNNA